MNTVFITGKLITSIPKSARISVIIPPRKYYANMREDERERFDWRYQDFLYATVKLLYENACTTLTERCHDNGHYN